MKVAFQTLGCRVNVYDTEAMAEMFVQDGYTLTDFDSVADVYVINTCTVTHMGEKKSRQYIHRAKRQNPQAIVAVVGCLAQVSKDEVMAIEGVDVIVGSRDKRDVVFQVNRAMAEGKQIVAVSDSLLLNHKFEDLGVTGYEGKTRAFLKIQDGCNRFCSYCIIPYARGGISSKNPQVLLKEIEALAGNGYREVILSGIHIASYGQELAEKMDLLDLLEAVEQIPGIERIRIGSIEPMFFQGERLSRVLALTKLCPHFHLSLQSGCDATLKRMNRRYTAEEFAAVVKALREAIPEVSLTTDVIVGFPGESEGEFEETAAFLEKLQLTRIHTFKYSPRKGTPAFNFPNEVESAVKEDRSRRVMMISRRGEEEFLARHVGQVLPVLFEEGKNGVHLGYTPNYLQVRVPSAVNLQGKILPTKLTGLKGDVLQGEILVDLGFSQPS